MGKFVVAIVVLELFCVMHLSYMQPFTDGYDSLDDLDGFGYDDVYPLRHYTSIEPYRFLGLGHSGLYHNVGSGYNDLGIYGGSGFSNLGTYGGSGYNNRGAHGGSGYSNLGIYGGSGTYGGSIYNNLGAYGGSGYSNLGIYGGSGFSNLGTYGGSGYSNLGTYGGSGGGSGYSNLRTYLSDYSRLGKYRLGGYNSLYGIGDFDYGDLFRRYSSLGSYQPRGSEYQGSYKNIGGYSNLEPYLYGGYNTENDVGPLSYLPSSYLRADKYNPGVYSAGNRKVRRGQHSKKTYK